MLNNIACDSYVLVVILASGCRDLATTMPNVATNTIRVGMQKDGMLLPISKTKTILSI
jgi:hypothetical protein